jgi:hypothetical protein
MIVQGSCRGDMAKLSIKILVLVLALGGALALALRQPVLASWEGPCGLITGQRYLEKYGHPRAFAVTFLLQPSPLRSLERPAGWYEHHTDMRKMTARRFELWVWPDRGLKVILADGLEDRASLCDPQETRRQCVGTQLTLAEFPAGMAEPDVEKRFGRPARLSDTTVNGQRIRIWRYDHGRAAHTTLTFLDGHLNSVCAGFAGNLTGTPQPDLPRPVAPASREALRIVAGPWQSGFPGAGLLRINPDNPGYLCGCIGTGTERLIIEKGSFDRKSRLLQITCESLPRHLHGQGTYLLSPDAQVLDGYIVWDGDWESWFWHRLSRPKRTGQSGDE